MLSLFMTHLLPSVRYIVSKCAHAGHDASFSSMSSCTLAVLVMFIPSLARVLVVNTADDTVSNGANVVNGINFCYCGFWASLSCQIG